MSRTRPYQMKAGGRRGGRRGQLVAPQQKPHLASVMVHMYMDQII